MIDGEFKNKINMRAYRIINDAGEIALQPEFDVVRILPDGKCVIKCYNHENHIQSEEDMTNTEISQYLRDNYIYDEDGIITGVNKN